MFSQIKEAAISEIRYVDVRYIEGLLYFVTDADVENTPPKNTGKVVFDAGFFKVETPIKQREIEIEKSNTPGTVP